MKTDTIPRPLLQKDIDAAYEHFARIACSIVNDDQKEARPQLFFVQMHDIEPGVISSVYAMEPDLMMALQNSGGAGKRAMTTVIAATLGDSDASPLPLREALQVQGHRADIAVHVTEAWCAAETEPGDDLRRLSPSQRLDRTEALMVLVHVKGHTVGQMMPIKTTAGLRHAEFIPLDSQAGILGGHMAMQGWDDVPETLRR